MFRDKLSDPIHRNIFQNYFSTHSIKFGGKEMHYSNEVLNPPQKKKEKKRREKKNKLHPDVVSKSHVILLERKKRLLKD